jgi:hypothetical protein
MLETEKLLTYIHGMRILALLLFCTFGLQAQISSLTLNNVKSIDQPQRIQMEINEKEIHVSGLSQLFKEAEIRFQYAPKYLECENCLTANFTVVYTLVVDYTFENAVGAKSAALIFKQSAKDQDFPTQGLKLTELTEHELISQESFLSTLERNPNLYVRMKELRGHVINNGAVFDKKSLRMGKLFKYSSN